MLLFVKTQISAAVSTAFFAIEALSVLELITPFTPFRLNFPNKIYEN